MPFTPFHFGPGLGLGLPLRKIVHAPTFILANVILDAEPFFVLFYGLNYPLHGYLHTFILASLVGILLGSIMFVLERFLRPLYKVFMLESVDTLRLKSFIAAGVLGTALHVLFDSPLYDDIRPFYPVGVNPFYNPVLSLEVYSLCVWMGMIGLTYYACLAVFHINKKLSKKS